MNPSGKRGFAIALSLLFATSGNATAQGDDFVFYSELASDWYEAGSYFEWQSTTENNNGAMVDVHYQTFGDPSDPQLLLVHGYPRSSFDYEEMIVHLQNDYSYLLEDDARLLDYFLREIVEFDDFAMFTHDRGVSVGLAFLIPLRTKAGLPAWRRVGCRFFGCARRRAAQCRRRTCRR